MTLRRFLTALILFAALCVPATANPPATQAPMLVAGGGPTPTISYVSTGTGQTGTTITYTAQNIGTASADRVVIVGITTGYTGTAAQTDSMTIGGVTATKLISGKISNTNSTYIGLFALNVTSGTTANIVTTVTTSANRSAIVVWNMTGTGGILTTKATGSSLATATTLAQTVSIATNGGGAAVAIAGDGISSGTAYSWSGTSLDVTGNMTGGTNPYSGSHLNLTDGSTLNAVGTEAGSALANGALAVSF